MQANSHRAAHEPLPTGRLTGPRAQRVSPGVRLVGFYYCFIFVLWPLAQDALGLEETSRVPLVLALTMLLTAFAKPVRHLDRRVLLLLFIFFACFMAAGLGSGEAFWNSLEELFRNWGMALAVLASVRNARDCAFVLRAATATALMSAFYGCLFLLPPLKPIGNALLALGLSSGIDAQATRMIGASADPSYFGVLLTPGLLYLLHRSLRLNKLVSLPAAGAAFLLLALLLSFSRTAWAGASVGVLVLLWRHGRTAAKTALVTAPVMLALVFYGLHDFLASVIRDNSQRATLDLSNQVDSRTWIWKAYWDLAVQKPWGYGAGSVEELRYVATTEILENSTARPHNMYLILLIERGVQALVSFLVILVNAARRGYRISESPARHAIPDVDAILAGLLASAVGVFSLGGMFQVPLLFIGLAFAADRIARQARRIAISPGSAIPPRTFLR